MKKLRAVVKRGREIGAVLTPHRHLDGTFVVSMDRFKENYIRVPDENQLVDWIARGYRVRMSNLDSQFHKAASLIAPNSIEIVDDLP